MCEYCGRDLPLIVDNKWCSELCKYAREVYEQGKSVVSLFDRKSYKRLPCKSIARHKLTFIEAPTRSKAYQEKHKRSTKLAANRIVEKKRENATNTWNSYSTEQFLKRCAINRKTQNRPEVAKRKSEGLIRAKSTLDYHERARIAAIECQNRPEVRRKHSEWASLAIAEGRFDVHTKIRGYFYTKRDERISFSSSYELRRFVQLERANIEFKRYHGIRIPYILNGDHNYTPDLLRVADNVLEEVKPLVRAREFVNVVKWAAARTFCEKSNFYKFETIFEDTLFRDISYEDFLKSMLVFPLRDRIEISVEVEERIRRNCGLIVEGIAA